MKKHKLTSIDQTGLASLASALAACDSQAEISRFLKDICTPSELQAMIDRWRVVPAIMAERPYRDIAEQTGVSVTTIGRVAKTIVYGEGGYRLVTQRLTQSQDRHSDTDPQDAEQSS